MTRTIGTGYSRRQTRAIGLGVQTLVTILLLCMLTVTIGCSPAPTSTECTGAVKVVKFSAQRADQKDPASKTYQPETGANLFDTDDTVKQVRENNAALRSLCGRKAG